MQEREKKTVTLVDIILFALFLVFFWYKLIVLAVIFWALSSIYFAVTVQR